MQNLPEALRRDQILNVATKMVRRDGFAVITCRSVAKEVGCSYRTVARLFQNRTKLSRAIIEHGADKWVVKEGERLGL